MAWRLRTSPTVRKSASCLMMIIKVSWRKKRRRACSPAILSMLTVEFWAGIKACRCIPSAQRKGLGLAAGKPLYVVALDVGRNRVIVGSNDDVYASELVAADMNFIAFDQLTEPLAVAAKIRYSAREADALITPLADGQVNVRFDRPQRAVTPGQSVVLYDGDIVLGGGIISQVVR